MKKLLAGIMVILILFFSIVYLLVPNEITVKQSIVFQTNLKGLFRTLAEPGNWGSWWPGKNNGADKKLVLNGNTYSVGNFTPSTIFVDIENPTVSAASSLLFIPLTHDSVRIEWQAQIPTSHNPIKRLQIYFAATSLEKDFHTILTAIPAHYTNDAKIYGLDIRRESVKDTSLVFTYDSSKSYPSTEKIYLLINQLRKYIEKYSAIATDSPMLNVHTADSVHYLTKVAIPTNKILPSTGNIYYKWMLPHGNILVADIKGDRLKADSAFNMMDNYVHDYDLTAPAIPFFKLITNRLQERDSTKWTTRIYYPVMYYH